jgi:hypothetical protein
MRMNGSVEALKTSLSLAMGVLDILSQRTETRRTFKGGCRAFVGLQITVLLRI